MNQTLSDLLQQLRGATTVEDVFGASSLTSAPALRRRYRALAALTHPDHHPDDAPAAHCLLYTSDAADERSSVDLGGRRIIKKKKTHTRQECRDTTAQHMRTKLSI